MTQQLALNPNVYTIAAERSGDATCIEQLTLGIFGPGMFARAAHALRQGVPHDPDLSFTARLGDTLVGTIRLTPITIGGNPALLLGPLAVLPSEKHKGAGRALMAAGIRAAREKCDQGGPELVLLVGDLAYYNQFGFRQIPDGSIRLPRPADPSRILVCELREDAFSRVRGVASKL